MICNCQLGRVIIPGLPRVKHRCYNLMYMKPFSYSEVILKFRVFLCINNTSATKTNSSYMSIHIFVYHLLFLSDSSVICYLWNQVWIHSIHSFRQPFSTYRQFYIYLLASRQYYFSIYSIYLKNDHMKILKNTPPDILISFGYIVRECTQWRF